ncbi:MAG: 1-(5-phosphoribosyl)-5-[(5-phosphoribosylamino)methylideneamino]imidazole-4-carboxamide isomerase [Balneolales bacterium]
MKVIPAIDLLDGHVVRLKKGAYDDVSRYQLNPIKQALEFKKAGFNHIHVVDLNGAREGRFINLPIIQDIIAETGLTVQSGGGVRTFTDAKKLVAAGITKIVCGSMAVKNEPEWLRTLHHFGGETCIMGLDLKNGKIAYSGWEETIDEDAFDFLQRMSDEGLQEILCTDISRDGMLTGVNLELYKSLTSQFPELNIIASGGVSGVSDLEDLVLLNMHAVVVGRAYYEGHISLEEMREFTG